MNVKKQVDHWLKTAEKDFETAKIILDAGKNYHYCLFFCHLVLEKALKALVVQCTGETPPKIHDLEVLAKKAKLALTEDEKDFFTLMTGYNLEARYPDVKFKVYKRSTRSLAEKLMQRTWEKFLWIKKLVTQ